MTALLPEKKYGGFQERPWHVALCFMPDTRMQFITRDVAMLMLPDREPWALDLETGDVEILRGVNPFDPFAMWEAGEYIARQAEIRRRAGG